MAKPVSSFALKSVLTAAAIASASGASAAPTFLLPSITSPILASSQFGTACAVTGTATHYAPEAIALAPETATFAPAIMSPAASKSSAILGGELSALDRIKQRQAQSQARALVQTQAPAQAIARAQEAPEPAALTLASATDAAKNLAAMEQLEPAAANIIPDIRPGCTPVQNSVSASARTDILSGQPSENYLASKRVKIGKTSFDRDWRRVSRQRNLGVLDEVVEGQADASLKTLEEVNRWVNREINYVEDRQLYGRADYWAGAGMTMAIRKGDCEDIALTKMQLLAEAGFKKSEMFLTIARDTVRRADHALLVVRINGRFVILDNTTDTLLDGSYSHEYAPVLSFSGRNSWLHGY